MTSLHFQPSHGVSYFPPLLREQEAMKKMAKSTLMSRLSLFNFSLKQGSKDDVLFSIFTRCLQKYATIPTGYALLDGIAQSDASIEVSRGVDTYTYQKRSGTIELVLSEDEINRVEWDMDAAPSIAQKSTGEMCLFTFPLETAVAHELVHILHMILGIIKENIAMEYPDDDLYFPNVEEMLTTMGYADYGTKRMRDPICEDAINRELGFPIRVAQKIPTQNPAFLGIDVEVQKIIADGRHRQVNYLRFAIDGASKKNQSRQGNQLKVIQLLIDAGCEQDHIYDSIEFLLADPISSPKLKVRILKMFGREIFHKMIRYEAFLFDYPRWIEVILAAEGPEGVKALLRSRDSEGYTPLRLAREIGAKELTSYLEGLEKESRYRYPIFASQIL